MAERAYLAPSGYSTAGPQDAYTFWTKTYNTDIGSVRPTSPNPCEVVVYILMRDGSLPGEEVISRLREFLHNSDIRPMTDFVSVSAPDVQSFDIDLTYYIDRSNQASAAAVQKRVEAAATGFIAWQTTEIGRDINPSELIRLIREASAKRIDVRSPEFGRV